MAAAEPPAWLRALPVAPEYRPTAAEFADPIAYILKIEPEASRFGICKIVPPLPAPAKKPTVARLEASFANAADPAADERERTTFLTRRQQVGLSPRARRPACRAVWQSGERYTLAEFEAKARHFERSHLAQLLQYKKSRRAAVAALLPLETEALFWSACAGRPITVEYANDMPGSGFAPPEEESLSGDVGATEWNMRRAPRARGSLLRHMPRDVAGVTSPMVYVAMLFSWFAWHVEDHELHSLNYLHFGAPKTWYGVPRDALLAFEDVVRVHGYGEEVNAIMTFEILNEKTTVMSPEVLLSAGVPCCRLVQNPGDFVITFPGAYHSGFSHGFNCGEAANIATPEWLQVAKEAAIRRASTNCGPLVSHYQLLYELALSLCSRVPKNCNVEPRSSRLKHKLKNEGEIMVKEKFVESVIRYNDLLSILVDKGSCIIVPEIVSPIPSFSAAMVTEVNLKQRLTVGLHGTQQAMEEIPADDVVVGITAGIGHLSGSQSANVSPLRSFSAAMTTEVNVKQRLTVGLHGTKQAMEEIPADHVVVGESAGIRHFSGFQSANEISFSACQRKKLYSTKCGKLEADSLCSSTSELQIRVGEKVTSLEGGGLLDQGRLPCVQCGILSFACVAVIQPREPAVRYVMSRDCISFNATHGEISDSDNISNWRTKNHEMVPRQGQSSGTDDNLVSSVYLAKVSDRCRQLYNSSVNGDTSALGLLASAYESSDSEEETRNNISTNADENDVENKGSNTQFLGTSDHCLSTVPRDETEMHLNGEEYEDRTTRVLMKPVELKSNLLAASWDTDISHCTWLGEQGPSIEQFSRHLDSVDGRTASGGNACRSTHLSNDKASMESNLLSMFQYNKDSSRMHVFCLEHALETWRQLQQIGGANIMLLCHPEYPRAQAEAKVFAEELGTNYEWKHITFREATEDDIGRIQLALQDEDAEPTSSDWAVKMGINMYYSANQSKSPLYSKQIPYNAIIYKAFGQETPDSSLENTRQISGRLKKKVVVAGRWCGKVWMSNQVHLYLAREPEEHNHEDIGYNQVSNQESKFSANSRHTTQGELSTGSFLISNSSLRRTSGRKRKMLMEKSRTKKKRCTTDHHEKQKDGDEIEEAPNTRPDQQPKLENMNKKLRSKKQTGERKNRKVHKEDLYDEDKDVKFLFDIKSRDEAAPGTWDRSQQQELDGMKMKSKLKMQANERKLSKGQTNGLFNGDYEAEYSCDIEGCTMSFSSQRDLALHKRNICPLKGCKKKFFSHKYLLQHRKVHMDDRPLKCPWRGCKKTFKWPWARTEHIRVHTGARPYICKEPGCGQTFRFVSDFSRHKRKTGHSSDKKKKNST